jgi:aryl-alcohol dehydrogenase-like predicted oxidoreductase
MEYRRLGDSGLKVSRIALGCMSFGDTSRGFSEWALGDEEAGPFFQQAIELGINFWDTANVYGYGSSEEIVGRAIQKYRLREDVVLATKVHFKMHDGPGGSGLSRKAIMEQIDASLTRLGTDYVDLYQPARLDPQVPIEDTVGAIAEMVQAGYVRYIGLSEVGAETIRRAHAVHPIAALQIEYSLVSRGIETEILPTIRELGIALVAYGVLSRGLISDSAQASKSAGEIRTRMPRFSDENFPRNMALVRALAAIAREKNASTAQLAFAWARSRGDDVVPLIGARRCDQLREALGALELTLTPADLARIAQAVPPEAVAGTRYRPAGLAHMDSEHAG